MVALPKIPRTDYYAYSAWDQIGFRNSAYSGGDLATRIEDAAAYCVTNSIKKLVVPAPPNGENRISRKIVIPANLSIDIQGKLEYTGSTNEVAIEIGAANSQTFEVDIRVWVTRATDSDWSTFNNCGILIHNPYNSRIMVGAEYFTLGAEFRATNFGVSHNEVWLHRFTNCRAGLKFYTAFANTSWINQNTWFSGRWQIESQKRSALGNPAAGVMDPTGIWMAGAGTGINNNKFINPSFEISGVEHVLNGWTRWPQVKPWLIDCEATVNTMEDARHENLYPNTADTVPFLWINSQNVSGNEVEIGYAGSITWNENDLVKYMTTDPGHHKGNRVRINYQSRVNLVEPVSSWNSGNLADKAIQAKSTGEITIPGVFFSEGNFLEEPVSYYTSYVIGPDYIGLAGGTVEALSWIIDTSQTKRLLIKADCRPGKADMRYVLIPYDSGGNALDGSNPATDPYCRFPGAFWFTDLKDGYKAGSNGDFPIQVALRNEVHTVRLHLMQSGATAAEIRSLSIASLDQGALNVRSLYPYTERYAYSAPASGWKGNWRTGQFIQNAGASASGDPIGWRVRSNGTAFDAVNP